MDTTVVKIWLIVAFFMVILAVIGFQLIATNYYLGLILFMIPMDFFVGSGFLWIFGDDGVDYSNTEEEKKKK